jgi:hypothetical protein
MSIADTVASKHNARGLALIMYNTYLTSEKPLGGTEVDAINMTDTLTSLGFAIRLLPSATKKEVKKAIEELASFPRYPKKYNCFVIYFAGHGDEKSILQYDDGENFNFERVILQRFNPKLNGAVSERIANVPILVCIDACRGRKNPELAVSRMQQVKYVPINIIVAYSTAEKYAAIGDRYGGGYWTQKLATRLRESNTSILETLKDVNNSFIGKYHDRAIPVTWKHKDSNVGNFKLKENVGEFGTLRCRF